MPLQIRSASVTHEIVRETSLLPVYFSSPGRKGQETMFCHHTDGITIPVHWHEHLEFIFPLKFCMTAVVECCHFDLSPGDLLIINSGELHMTKIFGQNGYCPYLLIQVSQERLKEFLPDLDFLHFTTYLSKERLTKTPGLTESLLEMQHLYEEQKDGYQLLFTARFFDFLSILYQNYCEPVIVRTENAQERDRRRIKEIVTWTQTNFRHPITLEDAAAQVGISKEYFCRLFKKYTGQTYLDYLCTIRTTHFYQDLLNSDQSIPLLMEQNGLVNYKTFMRTFRSLYGTTPMRARMDARSSQEAVL